jgi:hypothetical protein
VPINTASRGQRLQHIRSNSAARLLKLEGALAGNLDHLDVAALPLDMIWTIDADVPVRAGAITSKPGAVVTKACAEEALLSGPRRR